MEWRIVFEEAFITVVKGKRTHAVEDAAATVEKQCCVAVALQDAGDSFNVVRKVAFNDGITGQGRKGSKDAFHSAHGAISAGVDIGEEEAFIGGEFVLRFGLPFPNLERERLLREGVTCGELRVEDWGPFYGPQVRYFTMTDPARTQILFFEDRYGHDKQLMKTGSGIETRELQK